MTLLLVLLLGCNGCRPSLPSNTDDDPNPQDTSPPEDTSGDSATETADTSPPLPNRCDAMEVEPNNTLYEIEPLVMEEWLCGWYDKTNSPLGDIDFLGFTTTEGGWLEVNQEAGSRGSSADAQFTIIDTDNSVTVLSGYLTTDPRIVIPVPDPRTFTLALGETTYSSGEDYNWAILASMVKAPVVWSFPETEGNDTFTAANEFALGETVFGTIDHAGDLDWYHVVTPADATGVRFTVEAFSHGSPLDSTLVLYDTDGVTRLHSDYTGEVDYDPDPAFDFKQTEANDWYLLVKNATDGGSDFHWYTLTITPLYDE